MQLAYPIIAAAALFCAGTASAQDAVTDPVPIGDRSKWVIHTDWPNDLIQMHIEGSVRVELGVAPDGTVSGCEVKQTSGYDAMDNVVCSRLTQRGEFEPARNENGDAVAGTYETTVVFRFKDDPVELPPEGMVSIVMVIEEDGSVSDCHIEGRPPAGEQLPQCPRDILFRPPVDKDGNPVRLRVKSSFGTSYTELED